MEWIDKENLIAVIALQKCGIERARIYELLIPLYITRVLCIVLLSCFWKWEE